MAKQVTFTDKVKGVERPDIPENEKITYSDINEIKEAINLNATELIGKANISSPAFTGVPTVPTAATTTNSTQIATTAFVTSTFNNIIESGAWTPTLGGLIVRGNNTYVDQKGEWYRVGNAVNLKGIIRLSKKDPLMEGDVQIYGIPFSSKAITSACAIEYPGGLKITEEPRNVLSGFIARGKTQIALEFVNWGPRWLKPENITDATLMYIDSWIII